MNYGELYSQARRIVENELNPPASLPKLCSSKDTYFGWATVQLSLLAQYHALNAQFKRTYATQPTFQNIENVLKNRNEIAVSKEHCQMIESLAKKLAEWYDKNCPIQEAHGIIAGREHAHQLISLKKKFKLRKAPNPVSYCDILDYALQVREIVISNSFDCAVSLLWKGAPYAYFFAMQDLPTFHCEVKGERPKRNLKLEDANLEGKRVLIVEDDFYTGNTLRKAIQYFDKFEPASLSLYLGSIRKGGMHDTMNNFPDFFSEFEQIILGSGRDADVASENDPERLKAAHKAIEPLLRPHYK